MFEPVPLHRAVTCFLALIVLLLCWSAGQYYLSAGAAAVFLLALAVAWE